MKTLRDRYPEIDMAGDDRALEGLVGDLDHMGQAVRSAGLPTGHEMRIAAAIRAQATTVEPTIGARHRAHSLFRRHRPFAFVAVALGILMLTGGTYAAAPILTRVFDLGGAGSVIQRHLGKELDVSQTLGGYTMTIERVYADPNRILIAYSIRPPASPHRLWDMSTGNITLADGQGTMLPERSLVGDVGTTEPETTLQGFDAAAITGQPKELHLHLTVPWIDAMEQLHTPPGPGQSSMQVFPGLPATGPFGSQAIARPVGERDPWMQIVRTYGPISFDLTIPMERALEVTPRQQISAGGITLTLERVVVSPTETRAYVSGLNPNQSHYVHGVLSGDGWTDETVDGGSTSVWYANGMTVFSYLGSFMDKRGAWTLAVQPNPGAAGSAPAGSWTFHFPVP